LAARCLAARCLAARCSARRLAARCFALAFDAARLAFAARTEAALALVLSLASRAFAVDFRSSCDVLEPRRTGGVGVVCVRAGAVAVVVTVAACGKLATFFGSELLNAVRPSTNSATQAAGSPILIS
jgi:hypothetical protein